MAKKLPDLPGEFLGRDVGVAGLVKDPGGDPPFLGAHPQLVFEEFVEGADFGLAHRTVGLGHLGCKTDHGDHERLLSLQGIESDTGATRITLALACPRLYSNRWRPR